MEDILKQKKPKTRTEEALQKFPYLSLDLRLKLTFSSQTRIGDYETLDEIIEGIRLKKVAATTEPLLFEALGEVSAHRRVKDLEHHFDDLKSFTVDHNFEENDLVWLDDKNEIDSMAVVLEVFRDELHVETAGTSKDLRVAVKDVRKATPEEIVKQINLDVLKDELKEYHSNRIDDTDDPKELLDEYAERTEDFLGVFNLWVECRSDQIKMEKDAEC